MTNSIMKSAGTSLANINSLEVQFRLFEMYGLSTSMAERYKFEVVDGGGYKLVKRHRPIAIFDDGDHLRSISQSAKTDSERIHLSTTKGKYNDEWRLFDQDSASIEVKEVMPFRTL